MSHPFDLLLVMLFSAFGGIAHLCYKGVPWNWQRYLAAIITAICAGLLTWLGLDSLNTPPKLQLALIMAAAMASDNVLARYLGKPDDNGSKDNSNVTKTMLQVGLAVLIVFSVTGCLTNTKNNTDTKNYNTAGQLTQEVINEQESYFAPTYKFMGYELNVYALAASAYDPATGNFSPYIKIGIFTEKYKSFPVKPGQSLYLVDEEYSSSWWNWTTFFSGTPDTKTNLVRRTIVVIDKIPAGVTTAEVQTVDGVALTISKDGITSPKKVNVNLK